MKVLQMQWIDLTRESHRMLLEQQASSRES